MKNEKRSGLSHLIYTPFQVKNCWTMDLIFEEENKGSETKNETYPRDSLILPCLKNSESTNNDLHFMEVLKFLLYTGDISCLLDIFSH